MSILLAIIILLTILTYKSIAFRCFTLMIVGILVGVIFNPISMLVMIVVYNVMKGKGK